MKKMTESSTNPQANEGTATQADELSALNTFVFNLANEVKEYQNNTTKQLTSFQKKITEANREINEKVGSFDAKIEEKQSKTTEILAIFITLFTFVSINVNIFTRLTDAQTAVWFLLLTTVCCIVLVSFLLLAASYNPKRSKFTWIGLFAAIVLLAALIVITKFWHPAINPQPEPPSGKTTYITTALV